MSLRRSSGGGHSGAWACLGALPSDGGNTGKGKQDSQAELFRPRRKQRASNRSSRLECPPPDDRRRDIPCAQHPDEGILVKSPILRRTALSLCDVKREGILVNRRVKKALSR